MLGMGWLCATNTEMIRLITAVGGAEKNGAPRNRLLDTIGDMMRAWYRFVELRFVF